MPPESIAFRDPAGSDYTVTITSCTAALILRAAAVAHPFETGGILIGRYDLNGWTAEIVEATPKPPGSRSGRTWFHRSNVGLVELLKQRWADGRYYLGEWHYHPGGVPDASPTDKKTMQRISVDPFYQCSQPILIIAGGRSMNKLSLGVCIFSQQSFVILDQVANEDKNPICGI